MTKLHELNAVGQSPWLDYIRKDILTNGEMEKYILQGVRGVTSNPTIFENAITKSTLYQVDIEQLARSGMQTSEIYDVLAFSDIQKAADLLYPVYKDSDGSDGFISLEVPPDLCDDHEQTVREAQRIWKSVARPNLMVKVPATPEGLLAISDLIAEGINVNATLIFTHNVYQNVANAYMRGLERRLAQGNDVTNVASVASVFVSRIDSAVEKMINSILLPKLVGRVAIANTRYIYQIFKNEFESKRFYHLQENGARVQKPLWASTWARNPDLHDTLYVDELIGSDTVNTMPLATMTAFLEHGHIGHTIDRANFQEDAEILNLCEDSGVQLDVICNDLMKQGLLAFKDSFRNLLDSIEKARNSALN